MQLELVESRGRLKLRPPSPRAACLILDQPQKEGLHHFGMEILY